MYLASQKVTCVSPSLADGPLQPGLDGCDLLRQVIACARDEWHTQQHSSMQRCSQTFQEHCSDITTPMKKLCKRKSTAVTSHPKEELNSSAHVLRTAVRMCNV